MDHEGKIIMRDEFVKVILCEPKEGSLGLEVYVVFSLDCRNPLVLRFCVFFFSSKYIDTPILYHIFKIVDFVVFSNYIFPRKYVCSSFWSFVLFIAY